MIGLRNSQQIGKGGGGVELALLTGLIDQSLILHIPSGTATPRARNRLGMVRLQTSVVCNPRSQCCLVATDEARLIFQSRHRIASGASEGGDLREGLRPHVERPGEPFNITSASQRELVKAEVSQRECRPGCGEALRKSGRSRRELASVFIQDTHHGLHGEPRQLHRIGFRRIGLVHEEADMCACRQAARVPRQTRGLHVDGSEIIPGDEGQERRFGLSLDDNCERQNPRGGQQVTNAAQNIVFHVADCTSPIPSAVLRLRDDGAAWLPSQAALRSPSSWRSRPEIRFQLANVWFTILRMAGHPTTHRGFLHQRALLIRRVVSSVAPWARRRTAALFALRGACRAQRFVYFVGSEKHPDRYYTGLTSHAKLRLADQNNGHSQHTASGRPWRGIVVIAFTDHGAPFTGAALPADTAQSADATLSGSSCYQPAQAAVRALPWMTESKISRCFEQFYPRNAF